MLIKNQIYEAKIVDYTAEGQGVAKVDGCAVFIPNAIAGEICRVRIEKAAKTWAAGKIVEILEKSPHRINRLCPISSSCGGCDFHHMDYEEETRLKAARVRDCLNRLGGEQLESVPILSAPTCEGYRNKAQYPVGFRKGRAYAGFFKAGTHDIVENSRCSILPREADAVKDAVIDYVNQYKVPVYDEVAHTGLLRHIYVRRGAVSGQILVCLVVNGRKLPHVQDLVARLQKIEGFTTLVLSVNTKKGNTILGDEFITLHGPGYIEDTLCGLHFRLSARSFYQVNHHQAQRLYEAAISQAGITKDDTVLDLYCGVGTITLCMAKAAGRVIGVEVIPQAVADAKENALRNGIENAEFFCGDAGQAALELEKQGIKADVVIVDPPRKGLNADTIEALHRFSPRRIVYVSCDPATLGRDVALLKERGYRVLNAQAADLFPRCAHVESIVCLSREYINPFEKFDNTSTPLLYRAAQNSVYGQRYEFESGSITDAMFVYLDGSPSPKSMEALDRNYRLRPLVCLAGAWEEYIKKTFPNAYVCNRYMMKPACQFLLDDKIDLPDGFEVALFDEKAFALHPFSHGENYPSFAEFQEHGAGAVVWHHGKIVASASSFITVNDEIELDVSTEEAYRGKGLASACISVMLQDCAKRGIIVHWDAQNETSLHLAEKFGFEQECAYSVYFPPKRITDESVCTLVKEE